MCSSLALYGISDPCMLICMRFNKVFELELELETLLFMSFFEKMTRNYHHETCIRKLSLPCVQVTIKYRNQWVTVYWHIHLKGGISWGTVYPKKYAHGLCFAVLCCGYTLTDFPISIRLTSLALWQSDDCPSAGKATLMNLDKYFMWNHYERLHNHNKAKHNKTVCIFIGI